MGDEIFFITDILLNIFYVLTEQRNFTDREQSEGDQMMTAILAYSLHTLSLL